MLLKVVDKLVLKVKTVLYVMKSQKTGELLKAITHDGRFGIKAMFSIHMTLSMAEEFL